MQKTVTVFGGTGFIGAQIVRRLAHMGMAVKVATRHPKRAYFLQPFGHVGQIVPLQADYKSEQVLAEIIKGSDYVVNCVGILQEKHKDDFARLHAGLPGTLARLAKENGVSRFVHISALGADRSQARYARTKIEGEQAVFAAFPQATILRPSVVFGPGDSFFNRFAKMARFLPALPLIGGGETKFQPVFVGDVAAAVAKALTLPVPGAVNPLGKTYELGGPETLTFRQIYQKLFQATGRERFLLPLPWPLAKTQAALFKLMPNPPLTPDQVELLKTDNIVSQDALTLRDLGIEPAGLTLILNDYLEPYRQGGRFGDKKRA